MILSMDESKFPSRKRPRACQRTGAIEGLGKSAAKDSSYSSTVVVRKRGCMLTFQLAVCLGVLVVQLARVHSWSPALSSVIAKKSTPSAAIRIPGDSCHQPSGVSVLDYPTIPSTDSQSSRYIVYDPNIHRNNNHGPLKMVASSTGRQGPSAPTMLLGDDFISVANSLRANSFSMKTAISGTDGGKDLYLSDNVERRVLGFDVFELHAKASESTDHEEGPATVSAPAGAQQSQSASPGAPGLPWRNNPRSKNNEGVSLAETADQLNNLLKYSSSVLPAWFPWIPTKSQIAALQVKELREACTQRGLNQNGDMDALKIRLWEWSVQQQRQELARRNSDSLSSWLEEGDENDPNESLENLEDHYEDQFSSSSLATSLKKKRLEMNRRRSAGKLSTEGHKKDLVEGPAKTKEYLAKLSNAMKASPSSPLASNKDVTEIYDASKKADQMGEPRLAIELLESLMDLTPTDSRVYRRLSRMHKDQGNVDLALATLKKGLQTIPNSPWLWHGLGQLEISEGRTEYGISCYERALEEDPAFAHSYHAWGLHEFNNGEIAKAKEILSKGIEYCPTNHRLHHALGDVYQSAKMLGDAERSYKRALEVGPSVSHSFALSALAKVAYEEGNVHEARRWLKESITRNNGRHAQGWLSLAELEEAEGNIEEALSLCEASILQYENHLVRTQQRYTRESRTNEYSSARRRKQSEHRNHGEGMDVNEPFSDQLDFGMVSWRLLKSVPRYRSGDHFLSVFRHWARLEGRYGNYYGCNRVYKRASLAFPLDYKVKLDWARYLAKRGILRARRHFFEACSRASTRYAEPYREYACFEMSLGEYDQARKILSRGAQALSRSRDSSTLKANRQELPQLYVTWAVCEWYLGNIAQVEVLFDRALSLTDTGSDEGSKLRSFILFCVAQLQYYEQEKPYLAQHCISLCLKENSLPGGNSPVWNLWAEIARRLENSRLEEECLKEANRCEMRLRGRNEYYDAGLTALDTMNFVTVLRQAPWADKLRSVRSSGRDRNEPISKFYSSISLPNFDNHELRSTSAKFEIFQSSQEESAVG